MAFGALVGVTDWTLACATNEASVGDGILAGVTDGIMGAVTWHTGCK